MDETINAQRDRINEVSWEEVVRQVSLRKTEAQRKREIRRQMWDELGFVYTDMGLVLGDFCLQAGLLNSYQQKAFALELNRRMAEQTV